MVILQPWTCFFLCLRRCQHSLTYNRERLCYLQPSSSSMKMNPNLISLYEYSSRYSFNQNLVLTLLQHKYRYFTLLISTLVILSNDPNPFVSGSSQLVRYNRFILFLFQHQKRDWASCHTLSYFIRSATTIDPKLWSFSLNIRTVIDHKYFDDGNMKNISSPVLQWNQQFSPI